MEKIAHESAKIDVITPQLVDMKIKAHRLYDKVVSKRKSVEQELEWWRSHLEECELVLSEAERIGDEDSKIRILGLIRRSRDCKDRTRDLLEFYGQSEIDIYTDQYWLLH